MRLTGRGAADEECAFTVDDEIAPLDGQGLDLHGPSLALGLQGDFTKGKPRTVGFEQFQATI